MGLLEELEKKALKDLADANAAKAAAKKARESARKTRDLKTAITITRQKILGLAIDTVDLTDSERATVGKILMRLPEDKRTGDWNVVDSFLKAIPPDDEVIHFAPSRSDLKPKGENLDAAE